MSSPNYRVVWTKRAYHQVTMILADRLEAGISMSAVTESMNFIERILERVPQSAGESREDNLRIIFHGPVRVIFRTNAVKRMVFLKDVHDFERKPG